MSHRPSPIVAALAACLFVSIAVSSQERGDFGETAEVVAVEIPVQVLVDGKPVRGLTKENFEVTDGRKERPIVGFDVVDLTITSADGAAPAAAPAAPTAPAAGRRHFLVLFDLSNSEPAAIVKARSAAKDVVDQALHPSDLVAVATYSVSKGPSILLGFTTDRRQIDLAIETLGVPQLYDRTPDPLGLLLASVENAGQAVGGGSGGLARGEIEDAVLENLRQDAANERQVNRQNEANKVTAFTRGFADLGRLMGSLDGRKYVVFLSQGFDSSLITGSADAGDQEAFARSSESGEIWTINSEERFGNTKNANELERMIEEFRRADCVIQAVDIGGLAAAGDQRPRASGRETLFNMAKSTGGQLYENFNNLGQAMGSMLVSTSVTYVLTIQPDDLKFDGKFRPLKVKLRNAPSGSRVVARPGYYTPKPYQELRKVEQQMDTAQLLLAGQPGGTLLAGATAAAFRTNGARAHVPVIVEVDGRGLLATKQGNAVSAAIYVYAIDAAGSVLDYVAQPMQLDLAQVEAKLKQESLKLAGDLLLPAGVYRIRVLVRAGQGGDYWLGEVPLTVPDFSAPGVAALPPLLPEPMTKGLVVRASGSAEKTKGLPFPFMLKQEFFLPDAQPSVAPRGEVTFCWMAYNLTPGGSIEVSGSLVGPDGQAVAGSTARLIERTASDTPGLDRLVVAVSSGSAGPGDYTLRLRLAHGSQSAEGTTSLRVGG